MRDFKAIRLDLGLTQAELAAKLGLHQTTISRFETGDLLVDGRTRLALEALTARGDGDASQREAA